MTASISPGGTGLGCQLRSRHSFCPWKSPQSTRTCSPCCPLSSPERLMRCFDPVTVPAAPRNWMYAMCWLSVTDGCARRSRCEIVNYKPPITNYKCDSFARRRDVCGVIARDALRHAAVVDGHLLRLI